MSKKAATDDAVLAFVRSVFPEAPELATAAFDEAHVLRTATDTIESLRADLAQAQRERDEVKRQWGDPTPELKALRAAEQQVASLRTAIAQIVGELDLELQENGYPGPHAVTDAAVLKDWRDRLAALGGQP